MDEILREQRTIAHSLQRALDNAKKLGKSRLTVGVAQGRLTVLQEAWSRYRAQDGKLHALATDADKAKLDYFVKEELDVVEEHYLAACDYIHDRLAVLTNPLASGSTQVGDVSMTSRQSIQIKLPRIELPTFSGDYASWESYRDLFESLIVNNDTLSNTQRLHYLKASLTGEAGNLLKHVSVTEQNYQSAWDSLKARYDNERVIIHAHLTALFSTPAVGANTVQDLKRLRDTTAQSIAALQNLKRPVDQWDDLLVYLTAERLDSKSRSDWELSLGARTNYPTYVELDKFVTSRIRALESIAGSKQTAVSNHKSCPTTTGRSISTRSHVTTNTNTKCVLCDSPHQLYKCPQFVKQTVDQRRQIARDHRCCFNCLWVGHLPKQCPSKRTCSVCQRNHNTMLHMSGTPNVTAEANVSRDIAAQPALPSEPRPGTSVATHVAQGLSWQLNCPVLLATAWVTVQAPNGRSLQVRALVDQGSESSFVSESVAQTLHLSRQSMNTTVTGIGGSTVTTVRSKTSFVIESQYGARPSVAVSALVLPRLSSYAPPRMTGFNSWTHLHNLDLADPFLDNHVPIGLLIGSDLYGVILLDGVRKGSPGAPIAQNTIFGWILSGPISASRDGAAPTIAVHHCTTSDDLDVLIRNFWEIEAISKPTPLTEEDQRCEEHFMATHRRKSDGRYQVRLPFKSSLPLAIGNSLNKADACLAHLEKRFTRDASFSSMYHDFLDEYETLGHMAPMSSTTSSNQIPIVYIPHHPVVKESSSTTRLRVVFNASSPTTNGTSLNDHMFTGQKLQRDLSDIIVNWRSHKYVYTADIAKMYRQILVDLRDTPYQCIRWRRSPDQDILTFELLTVTYGTAAAPYLALRVLSQLSVDEGDAFPQAQPVLNENFYVDDVLFGADSLESAQEIREQLITLLKRGGFHLRKWTSNHRDLLAHIPVVDQEQTVTHPMQETEGIKVLGLLWNPESDSFSFHVTVPPLKTITKRSVLSFIARLFDPLGWMAPIVITAKILMQKLWVQQLEWDSTLPLDLRTQWLTYCEALSHLQTVSIPRWNGMTTGCTYELHGFADASTQAYAAVIYLCVHKGTTYHTSTLLIAKTRVAPVKTISLPRLELCAAVLLTQLLSTVQSIMKLHETPTFGWTDSTIVLSWLAQHASTWPTFVANRVAEIQTSQPRIRWSHVASAENAADCASRGIPVEDLLNHPLWWKGPCWLHCDQSQWPPTYVANNVTTIESCDNVTSHVAWTVPLSWPLIDLVSTWPRLLRITAYCFKFIERFHAQQPNPSDPIHRARCFLLQFAQRSVFSSEFQSLQNDQSVDKKSPLKRLRPFLDDNGLMRVGGRLDNSILSYDERHPVILPRHRVSNMLVAQAHHRSLHGGPQLTLRLLRQNVWILGARNLVRSHINHCVTCIRERAVSPHQIMANLPRCRVTPARPFLHSGVDYAGPILVRTMKGRGHAAHKAYVAVFVCFTTRAIHLELVSDYSSATFVAAFKRFVSRRGLPAAMYSDNGTTFQGADKDLRQALHAITKDSDLHDQIGSNGTKWHFLPPAAPHFGGLWEAGVKCVKHHLRRVLGSNTLTFEELNTLLCQIEACLNSRPISPMSNDPDDFAPLTPGHFLTGAPLLAVPEPSVLELNVNRLSRWQLTRQMVEVFWKRWSTEYLHTLQQRYKWHEATPNLAPNDLVLLRNSLLPPAKWQLARVLRCHPGPDGHVRVVDVRTARSEFRRPITQLCLLPERQTEA